MQNFIETNARELQISPFKKIGDEWMLITAAKGDRANTMTASWGGMGVLWGSDVIYAVIRPQRYTKEFVDDSDTFSISFYGEEYQDALSYFGKVSGRDEDKIAHMGFSVRWDNGTPYFEEAKLVFVCQKLFAQELSADSFLDKDILQRWYPAGDLHTLYVGKIIKTLVKK